MIPFGYVWLLGSWATRIKCHMCISHSSYFGHYIPCRTLFFSCWFLQDTCRQFLAILYICMYACHCIPQFWFYQFCCYRYCSWFWCLNVGDVAEVMTTLPCLTLTAWVPWPEMLLLSALKIATWCHSWMIRFDLFAEYLQNILSLYHLYHLLGPVLLCIRRYPEPLEAEKWQLSDVPRRTDQEIPRNDGLPNWLAHTWSNCNWHDYSIILLAWPGRNPMMFMLVCMRGSLGNQD